MAPAAPRSVGLSQVPVLWPSLKLREVTNPSYLVILTFSTTLKLELLLYSTINQSTIDTCTCS